MARLICAALLIGAAIYTPATTTAQKAATLDVLVIVEPKPQLRGQAIAQSRANYMAARGYKGHPPKSAGNQWTSRASDGEAMKTHRIHRLALAGRLGGLVQQMIEAGSC